MIKPYQKGLARPRNTGFTLIELMVTLTIVALLLMVAVPAYRSYTLRGQRAEAYQALLAVEQREQRYYLFNSAYAASLTTLGLGTQSTGGLYTISLTSTAGTYTATATASGTQTADSNCTTLTLQVTSLASGATYSPSSCWGR